MTFILFFFFVIQGSPLSGSFPGPGQAADQLHPGGFSLSPKAQYPLCDRDEQFASGWRRTQKHDNWPPKALTSRADSSRQNDFYVSFDFFVYFVLNIFSSPLLVYIYEKHTKRFWIITQLKGLYLTKIINSGNKLYLT